MQFIVRVPYAIILTIVIFATGTAQIRVHFFYKQKEDEGEAQRVFAATFLPKREPNPGTCVRVCVCGLNTHPKMVLI